MGLVNRIIDLDLVKPSTTKTIKVDWEIRR